MTASPFLYQPPVSDPHMVVFEDAHILVVNKPAGLLSVPGRLPQHQDSLFLRLQALHPDVLVVHRLDMATSGLMVFARGAAPHRALSMAFEQRRVQKRYLARVLGCPQISSGRIELPLTADWPNRPLQKVDHETGKPSCTDWERVSADGQTSLLRLTPVTGRTHQLRVHLAAIGHPILGDEFYGLGTSEPLSDRLCLHASELGFDHPVTGRPLRFETPSGPEDFALSGETGT